jgi:hypothetical protein
MEPHQALEVMEKLRQKSTLTGQEHDTVRQAIMVLAQMVNLHGEAKTENKEGAAAQDCESAA